MTIEFPDYDWFSHLPPGGRRVGDGTDCAEWIRSAVRPRQPIGRRLDEIVPPVFAAYARVLHPAHSLHQSASRWVRWRDLAAPAGIDIDRLVQWPSLIGHLAERGHSGWDEPPPEGTLPKPVCRPLLDILTSHTTSETGVFVYWHGYGFIQTEEDLCLTGPLQAVCAMPSMLGIGDDPATPTYWWPDDRAWLVVSDIDVPSTYVGASREAVADLLAARDRLEVFEAFPHDRVEPGG